MSGKGCDVEQKGKLRSEQGGEGRSECVARDLPRRPVRGNFGERARHARYLAMAGQTPLAVMLHTRKFQTLGGTISLSGAWGMCVCFPRLLGS